MILTLNTQGFVYLKFVKYMYQLILHHHENTPV